MVGGGLGAFSFYIYLEVPTHLLLHRLHTRYICQDLHWSLPVVWTIYNVVPLKSTVQTSKLYFDVLLLHSFSCNYV